MRKCADCGKEFSFFECMAAFRSKKTGKVYSFSHGGIKEQMDDVKKGGIIGPEVNEIERLCKECAAKAKQVESTTNSNLIQCPDCGKAISKRAYSCPHCGCPVSEVIEQEQENMKPVSTLESPKCPTCGSTDIEKISTGKKLAYVAGFGILAPAFKKARSQFECKSCGYKW
jgi:DNA-directed RNA polymerase subunit RPC12/RpoP